MITICLWAYIHHVRYHLKAYLFFFQLVHYLLWLPGRNVRKVIILDAMSKNKCSKIAPLFEIQHDVLFRRISVQWMGSGYVCIRSQKGSTKLDIACNSHTIWSILQLFLFDIAPNFLTLHTPQWNNPNKKGINWKANKQAFQGYLTWWIQIQDKRNIIDQSRVALLFLKGVCI